MSVFHCFFCGGKECKYENYQLWLKNKDNPNAIPGLFSNWITTNILATQRPSTRIMKEFNIVTAFKKEGINSIMNLEQLNEHAFCGDGIITESGFSYLPEDFMEAGIRRESSKQDWILKRKDMDIPNVAFMLSICQVISHALQEGKKIAIHCHAGLGRTGLTIACYLIFDQRLSATEAITLVRKKRPLSVQTKKQTAFVFYFEESLKRFRKVYPEFKVPYTPGASSRTLNLEDYMAWQRQYSHGIERRKLSYFPKIIYVLVNKLIQMMEAQNITSPASLFKTFMAFDGMCQLSEDIKVLFTELNQDNWSYIDSIKDASLIMTTLLIWIISLNNPLLTYGNIKEIKKYSSEPTFQTYCHLIKKEKLYTIVYLIFLFRERIPIQLGDSSSFLGKLATLISPLRSELKSPFIFTSRNIEATALDSPMNQQYENIPVAKPGNSLPQQSMKADNNELTSKELAHVTHHFLKYLNSFYFTGEKDGVSVCYFNDSASTKENLLNEAAQSILSKQELEVKSIISSINQKDNDDRKEMTDILASLQRLDEFSVVPPSRRKSHSMDTLALEEILKETETFGGLKQSKSIPNMSFGEYPQSSNIIENMATIPSKLSVSNYSSSFTSFTSDRISTFTSSTKQADPLRSRSLSQIDLLQDPEKGGFWNEILQIINILINFSYISSHEGKEIRRLARQHNEKLLSLYIDCTHQARSPQVGAPSECEKKENSSENMFRHSLAGDEVFLSLFTSCIKDLTERKWTHSKFQNEHTQSGKEKSVITLHPLATSLKISKKESNVSLSTV